MTFLEADAIGPRYVTNLTLEPSPQCIGVRTLPKTLNGNLFMKPNDRHLKQHSSKTHVMKAMHPAPEFLF